MDLKEIKNEIKHSFDAESQLRLQRIALAEKIAESIGEFYGHITPYKTEFGYFCGCKQDPNSNYWYAILSNNGEETRYDISGMSMNDLTLCLKFLQAEYESRCLKEYVVECTATYYGHIKVKATSEMEAINNAEALLNAETLNISPNEVEVGNVNFTFGNASGYNAYRADENE